MLDNPVFWSLHLPMKAADFDNKEESTWIAVPDLKSIVAKDKLSSGNGRPLTTWVFCLMYNILIWSFSPIGVTIYCALFIKIFLEIG